MIIESKSISSFDTSVTRINLSLFRRINCNNLTIFYWCFKITSYSTLRTCGSKETYEKICEAFRPVAKEHIAVYGAHNDQRLTGLHETASINDFSYGVSDRGASIRIPIITVEKGWKGWLEDRRPASNADPYKIASRIIKTVKGT